MKGEKEVLLDNVGRIKDELDAIENMNLIVKEFEDKNILHRKKFLDNKGNAQLALKIKLLNSEIREKQEITEKLKVLLYHLTLLKAIPITKDYNAAKRCMDQFTKNNFVKVSVVLNDIDKLGQKIKNLEEHYSRLLGENSSLDIKIDGEFQVKKLIENLALIKDKQQKITVAMSKDFVRTAKSLVNDDRYKGFLDGSENL